MDNSKPTGAAGVPPYESNHSWRDTCCAIWHSFDIPTTGYGTEAGCAIDSSGGVGNLVAVRYRGRSNLYFSTQPVRLMAWSIGFIMAAITIIILVAKAVGAF
jgi:hypothetical protein